MILDWVTVGPFQENAYLLGDPVSRRAVFVDPGDDAERILRMAQSRDLTPDAIWLTHAHLDHVGAIAGIRRVLPDIPVLLHAEDLPLYGRAAEQAAFYGLSFEQPPDPSGALVDGQEVSVGGLRFTVRHTPGHAPGHVIFVGQDVMLGGDLLFKGSVGRTDLPLADPSRMEQSLALLPGLDSRITVYPGHGPPTTIGEELATNPFLAGVRASI